MQPRAHSIVFCRREITNLRSQCTALFRTCRIPAYTTEKELNMSNQESQFSEQLPDDQRNINTDPREQWQGRQQQEYYGEQGPYPEKIAVGGPYGQPMRPRRRGPWRWIILAIAIVLLATIGSCLLGTVFGLGSMGSTTLEPRHFAVSAHPTLQINDDIGSIDVHKGDSGTITVKATEHRAFGGNPNDIQVHYDQNTSTNTLVVTITRTGGSGFFNASSVNFDVTVPSNTDLNLKTNTGEVDVSDLSGQMSLASNTGSIDASRDALSGDSILSTNTGSVNFEGSIDTTGNYRFTSNTGSVNVTLPGSTSFHVDAKTDTGSINTEFSGVNIIHHDVGSEAHDDVGNSPQAHVTLTTNTGSINLRKGA
jgi:hypothetical protein